MLTTNDSNKSNSLTKSLQLLASTTAKDHEASDTDSTANSSSSDSSGSDLVYSDPSKGIFSFYQVGDGSAEDPDGIPDRHLDMANQNRLKALDAMQATLEWREANQIDNLLNKPHTKFDACKKAVPHAYVGRDVNGHVVYVQQPAKMDKKVVQANGLTEEDLVNHAIFIQEYLWQVVEADDANATVTNIMDAGDLCLGDLRRKQDQVQLFIRMAEIFDNHFPTRAHKTIIVNAPSWFNALFCLIKPVLRESSASMVEICSKGKKQDQILLQTIGEETCKSLPDFCWNKPHKRGAIDMASAASLDMEKDLRAFVMERIETNGKTMAPVLLP